MKTMFKHKLMVALAVAATLFASYSCEDNDESYPPLANAEVTSLEFMQNDPQLTSFLEVVDKCGCLDSLLNQSRVYTIWAPVNEAVDKDALIERIENGEREAVFQEFVKYHISNFLHPANGTLEDDNNLLMLNGKYALFAGNINDGYTFGGNEIIQTNIRTKNGIVHKIAAKLEYKPSIWEALKSVKSIDSFWDFCHSFTVKEIDHGNSIPGPIVNQQQTYLDTAYYETNEILNFSNLGPIDNEDSIYIVYAPTAEVWNKVTAEAENYYRFYTDEFDEEQKYEADSLAKVRGAKDYLRYMTFSMTEQDFADGVIDFANLPDSLVSFHRQEPRKKFASVDLVSTYEPIETSNGQLRILDYMPFKPTDLWHDTIRIEAESAGNVRKDEYDDFVQRGTFATVRVNEKEMNPLYEKTKISGNNYLLASADGGVLPTRTYFVKNILSAKYKIALIAVPEDILEKGDGTKNKNQSAISVLVTQRGETLCEFPDPSVAVNLQGGAGKAFLPDDVIRPEKAAVDTIFLCDAETGEPHVFDFKYCESYAGFSTWDYKDRDYTTEITISTVKLAKKQGKNYRQETAVDNSFRIDAVLIIPVEDENDTETDTETEQ